MLPPFHQHRKEVGAACGRAGTISAPDQMESPLSGDPGQLAMDTHTSLI